MFAAQQGPYEWKMSSWCVICAAAASLQDVTVFPQVLE